MEREGRWYMSGIRWIYHRPRGTSKYLVYRISSNNSHSSINLLPWIIASCPPPPPFHPYRLPARNTHTGKLRGLELKWSLIKTDQDDSSSDVEDIDIENKSRNQIWNTLNANVQFIWRDYIFWFNEKVEQIFRERLPVSSVCNNRFPPMSSRPAPF